MIPTREQIAEWRTASEFNRNGLHQAAQRRVLDALEATIAQRDALLAEHRIVAESVVPGILSLGPWFASLHEAHVVAEEVLKCDNSKT